MKGEEACFYARVKVYFYIFFVSIPNLLIISFDKKGVFSCDVYYERSFCVDGEARRHWKRERELLSVSQIVAFQLI